MRVWAALATASPPSSFHSENCSLLPGHRVRASVAGVDLIIWVHLFHKTVHIEDKILRLGFEGNLQLMRYFQFLSFGS